MERVSLLSEKDRRHVDIGVQHLDEDISLCVQEYLENSPRWKRLDDTNKRNIEGWLVHEADGKYVDQFRHIKRSYCIDLSN